MRVEPIEDRLHPGIGVRPAGVRLHLIDIAYVSRDGVFEPGETADGGRRQRCAADDAAFGLLRNHDRHAINACLDLQPQLGLGTAARGYDPLEPAAGCLFHDTEVAGGGEGDAFEDSAMEMREPMPRPEAEELRPRIAVRAEPLAREIRHEEEAVRARGRGGGARADVSIRELRLVTRSP